MANLIIKGNALDFQVLITCLQVSGGTPSQNRAKDTLLDEIMKVWPQLDRDRQDVERIDDRSEEAKKIREVQTDTETQGAMAETFLAAVRTDSTTGARFRMFRRAAKLIQVSQWWERQTGAQKLQPFKFGDSPESYSDAPAPCESEARDQKP